MVAVIRGLNLGRTDTAAKTGEQIMAILLFAAALVALSLVFFLFISPRLRQASGARSSHVRAGIVFGVLVGIAVAAVVAGLDRSGVTSPVFNWAWLLIAFGLWGGAHGWVDPALAQRTVEGTMGGEGITAPALAEPRAALAASPSQMAALNRRQFLITLAGASATVTLVGAGLSTLLYNPAPDAAASEAAQTPLNLGPTPTI